MQKKTKKGLLITLITIIVASVGFFADLFNVVDVTTKKFCAKTINVGILQTLKRESYKTFLEDTYVIPANKRLSDLNINYKFKLKEVSYTGMYEDLKSGNIDIAFSSPYTYIAYLNKKITQSDIIVEAVRRQANTGNIYWSYLIYNKNSIFKINDSTLTKENYEKGKFKFFIGNNWSSTSTRVIPNIFLWEKGIILKPTTNQYDREHMIDTICKANSENCFIGFLSSSDYNVLSYKEKQRIGYYYIEIPIPSDPILINKTNFYSKFGKKDGENILNAISGAEMIEKTEKWIYPEFEKYVATGVVYQIKNNEIYIIFPNDKNDLDSNLIKVKIGTKVSFIKFMITNGITNSMLLESKLIGNGEITEKIYVDSFIAKFKANFNGNIYIGNHVKLEY